MFLVLTGFGHAGALAEGKFEPQGRTGSAPPPVARAAGVFSLVGGVPAPEVLCGTPHAHPLFDLLTGGAYVHLYYIFILVQFVLLAGFLFVSRCRGIRGG